MTLRSLLSLLASFKLFLLSRLHCLLLLWIFFKRAEVALLAWVNQWRRRTGASALPLTSRSAPGDFPPGNAFSLKSQQVFIKGESTVGELPAGPNTSSERKHMYALYLQLRFGHFAAFVHVQSRERVPDGLEKFVPQRHDGGLSLSPACGRASVSSSVCLPVWTVCWTRWGRVTWRAVGAPVPHEDERRAAAPLSERKHTKHCRECVCVCRVSARPASDNVLQYKTIEVQKYCIQKVFASKMDSRYQK